MQRKLKWNKNIKDSVTKTQQTEVVVLSSCSEDEQHPEKRTCLKTAPIFLRTNRLRRRKSSNGDSDQQKSVVLADVVRSPPTVSQDPEVSSWRGQLLPSCLQTVLEEIHASNPAFPLHTVFSCLQKKTDLKLHEFVSADSLLKSPNKKKKPGNEISERFSKRLRSSPCGEAGTGLCPLLGQDVQERTVLRGTKQSGGNKLSHTHRQEHHTHRPEHHTHMDQIESLRASDMLHGDSRSGEFLWTDKYSPQHSGEVIGHSASVSKLHSWLKKWKLRADSDERRKAEERKREERAFQISDSWDCGDFQGEALLDKGGEEPLCNTMLLTGPPGVGKTASVYACAQELGFKVFEVNCSSQRSGRLVLSQLQEATQSHLVEASGEGRLKPAYFNSCTPKPEALPGKLHLPQCAPSASKRKAARNSRSSGRRRVAAKPAAVTLAHYFKAKQKADHLLSAKSDGKKTTANALQDCDQTAPQGRKMATSLILFEEVDVIFKEDVGFLAAIKAFMTTTKRPVILTTNDPSFKERFDCSLEEIIFKTPSAVNVCSYLQLVCLAEEVRVDPDDISSLFRLTCGDVRRCLLQLQLWIHSGGGHASQIGETKESETSTRGGSDPQLPLGRAGCSASMLGLHSVTLKYLLNLLKSQSWSQADIEGLLKLLAESWRRDVPLLYANLELLLSLGAAETSLHQLENKTASQLQTEPRRCDADFHIQKLNLNPAPKVSCSKPVGSVSRLSRKRHTVLAESHLTVKPQNPPFSLRGTQSGARCLSNKPELAARVAADGLDALADLFDLMSCIDTLSDTGRVVSGSPRPEAFVWTGAAVKDGLLDEISEEGRESRSQDRLRDIKAAAEGFGFHQCWWRMSQTWTEAQKYKQKEDKEWKRLQDKRLITKRLNLSFSAQPLWASSVSERSYRVSRMMLSSKSFSLLGNRQAVAVDYMPVLRFLCARQKVELRRCLNHRSGTHLGLSRSTVQLLAEDFPLKKVWKNM